MMRWPGGPRPDGSLPDMMFSVMVETRLRPGIADPQGATIERSMPHGALDAGA